MISISHSWRAQRYLLGYSNRDQWRSEIRATPWCDCESVTSWAPNSVTRDSNKESSIERIFLSRYELSAYLIVKFGKWILDTYIDSSPSNSALPWLVFRSKLLSEDCIWAESKLGAAYWHKKRQQNLCIHRLLATVYGWSVFNTLISERSVVNNALATT